MDFLKLPSVTKLDDEVYQSRSLNVSFQLIRDIRQNLILEAAKSFNPDCLLIDHSPLGVKGELRQTLDWLKSYRPECKLVLGLRDLLDEPRKVIATWKRQGIYEILDTIYDQIFVYGSPDIFDAVQAYGLRQAAREKTVYTGFIVGTNDESGAEIPNVLKDGVLSRIWFSLRPGP